MKKEKTIILNADQIRQKIVRIAYEIYENNFESESIIIVGIQGSGLQLAEKVYAQLKEIAAININFIELKINKKSPNIESINFDFPKEKLKNQTVVFVDDVINSGKTMAFAVYHFLPFQLKTIKVAVLVDRQHRQYPVKTDYVGLTLSTTLQDHIEVNLKEELAYLV